MSTLQDLVDLVRSGDLQHVEDFLSTHHIDLNQVTTSSVSPLMVACKNGHLEIVELLLQKGAHMNFENKRHETALMAAAEGGNVEVVNLLLEHGADTSTGGDKTALSLACEQGSVEVVKVLLTKIKFFTKMITRDIECFGWNFEYTHSPLSIAVEHGNIELVKWFLEGSADVDKMAKMLFLAISKRNDNMVKALLENGANVNETGEGGWTALMQASFLGESDIVQTLLNNDAEFNRKGTTPHQAEDCSALMLAASDGHTEVVRVLLKAGAKDNVNWKGFGGVTALTSVLQYTKRRLTLTVLETVKLLLDGGADVNVEDGLGQTPLMNAAQWYPEVLKLLLEKNPKIDYKNSDGDYALKKAVRVGNVASVQILLEAGAKTDMKDKKGASLLMDACTHPVELTKLLLDHGLPIGLRDNKGTDALLHAVECRRYKIVEELLERGADPTLRPDHGSNAKNSLQKNINFVLVS